MLLKIAVGLIFLALIATGGYFIWQKNQSFPLGPAECEECGRVKKDVSWEECIKIPGAVIMEIYPEKCSAPDGRSAVKPLAQNQENQHDWKTLTTSSFSLNYPSTWTVEKDDFVELYFLRNPSDLDSVLVAYTPAPIGQIVADSRESYPETTKEGVLKTKHVDWVTLQTPTEPGSKKMRNRFLTPSNNITLDVSWRVNSDPDKERVNEQILESFKFL